MKNILLLLFLSVCATFVHAQEAGLHQIAVNDFASLNWPLSIV